MALPLVGTFKGLSFSPFPCSLHGSSRGEREFAIRHRGSREVRRRWNSLVLHCANEVNVVPEDDTANDDADETTPDAMDNNTNADGDAADVLESSSPDDVDPIAWIKQQPLPYPLDALEPYMSRETVEQHWGIHQRAHLDRLNGMIGGSEWEGMSLGQMMLSSFNQGREPPYPPFFHAAQIWNHDFFWRSMKPGGGGEPPRRLLKLINRDFGSFDAMIQQFIDAALTQFGSGWVWLSYKRSTLPVGNSRNPILSENYGRLVISKTPNAVNPLVWGHSPILAIDVWEHAYYLDYENRRADYVSTFLEKLVSWETVDSRLNRVIARAAERDGRSKRKQIRKQPVARSKSHPRARTQQVNGDARGQPQGQPRRRPRNHQQQDPGGATRQPAALVQQAARRVELDHEVGDL